MSTPVRPGGTADLDAVIAIFESSNLARRHGDWPHRSASVARLGDSLRKPGSWFLVAEDGSRIVGMALAEPLREDDGAGAVVPGGCFLSYLYVLPDRWGEGIGGLIVDAVLADATRRSYRRMVLWTHEDNARSHRLYRSRGFAPTGRVVDGEGEWMREIASESPKHQPL